MEEKITFFDTETNEEVEFYVLETTTLNEIEYLLVTLEPEGDSEALIMKKTAELDGEEASYVIVEDDGELDSIAKIFMEILEDVDIQ